jgi:hypothetical protein
METEVSDCMAFMSQHPANGLEEQRLVQRQTDEQYFVWHG